MKAQLSVIFERILGSDQRALWYRQPVHQPRQQETHGRASREDGERITLGHRKRTDHAIAVEQRPPFGDVVGMIGLEAPCIEANGNVIGECIRAGEIEIDQAGNLVAEEENVVRKKISMDYALRQIAWPGFLERIELFCYVRTKSLPYGIAAALGVVIEMPPAFERQSVPAFRVKIATRQMQPCQRVTHRPAMPRGRSPDP